MKRYTTIAGLLAILLTVACAPTTTPTVPSVVEKPVQDFVWADGIALLGRVPCCESTVDKNTRWLMDQMFDGLVAYAPGTSEIIPSLAKSWEISEDGLTWTFHLREDVTFSDGTPLTAEAVKYSLELSQSPESKVLSRIASYEDVTVVNAHTVAITTAEPSSVLLHGLQEVGGLIQSPASTPDRPIGTGPYILKEWNRGEKVTLERREDYWGELPTLERIVYLKRPEATTRVIQLLNGEIYLAAKLPPESIADLKKTAGVEPIIPESSMQVRINLNTRVSPYNEKLVRQAFNYAVNKKAIVDNILLGSGRVPTGMAGRGVWGTLEIEGGYYPYNPGKAAVLMREAGFEKTDGVWHRGGEPLVFRLLVPEGRYLKDRVVGEYAAQRLEEFGVKVELEVGPWSIVANNSRARLIAKEIDGWLSGFSLLHPVVNWASSFHSSNKDRLETGYDNPEFDRLVDQAAVTFDEEKQLELYHAAQVILIEDAPVMMLYNQSPVWGVREEVAGLQFTPNEIPITFGVSIGQ